MANKEFDTLHRDMQRIIKVLEQNNKIQSDRNKLLRKYFESTIPEFSHNINAESNDQSNFITENIDYVNQMASNHETGFVMGDPIKRESLL